MPKIQVMVERCKGCETCNAACPVGIIRMSAQLNSHGFKYAQVADRPRCIGCRRCAISCPDSAIEVFIEGTQYEFFRY